MKFFSLRANERWGVPACFLILFIAFHLIFGRFFPAKYGTLGHDYSRVLPDFLDGYFWFKSNSIFEPFWFTPSFCGGQPALGDPAFIFYSVTQFLIFFINPVTSIYTTVLLFASLGFLGFYLLLRSCFGVSRSGAVLGGALFMFNGFFIHRMMIGHFIYHGVMLIPLIAWLLLRPIERERASSNFISGIVAGCVVAYGIYAGLISLLLPCSFAVLAIISIHKLSGRVTLGFVQRFLSFSLVAAGLSATKLVATQSFLHNFPRSDYALPGISGIGNALQILFSALFISPIDMSDQVQPLMENMQWYLDQHEWEFGVTVIPLLIILAGVLAMFVRKVGSRLDIALVQWAWVCVFGFILILPIVLNIYTPSWNAFLKQLPVIKSNSNLIRWFFIYIPTTIVITALLFDKISNVPKLKYGLLVVALIALVSMNAFKDRSFYDNQPYQPSVIVKAWQSANSQGVHARIQSIGGYVDSRNNIQMSANGNDLIASGVSQLACYNTVFGYRLEHFPVKTLHPGSILEEVNGRLNIKNPACYVYPEENGCLPGDHFTVAQRKSAQAFANYRPFPFKFSTTQKIANGLTQITLALLAGLFVFMLLRKGFRLFKER